SAAGTKVITVKGEPIAARRSGVKTVIFPLANKKDFDEPAPNVKEVSLIEVQSVLTGHHVMYSVVASVMEERDWKPGESRAVLRCFVMENRYNYQPQGPFDHLLNLKKLKLKL
ncbi:lon protease homolog 1, mitochondrial-like protein, partial [Tanacetum coccineum]